MLDKDTIASLGYLAVMPDFYIDRIVKLNSLDDLFLMLKAKLDTGGSIRGIEQYEIKGGNATNLAYASSMLGLNTILITAADGYGKVILKHAFKDLNTKLIIKDGKQGYTVSFEIKDIANIMVSDSGINARFNPRILEDEDIKVLKDADAIAIVNWASNYDGNELVKHVFSLNDSLHILDPADISNRKGEFLALLKELDDIILSINDNEARILASMLGIDMPKYYDGNDIRHVAYELADRLRIRIDIHTPKGSASSDAKDTAYADAFKVDAKILTGAGDVWDAADIICYLADLDDHDRLRFANAASALYVSNAYPPTIEQVNHLLGY